MSMTDVTESEASPAERPAQAPIDPKPEVLLIQRMSVKYDGLEDRIALDISNLAGKVARLWLTRHGSGVMVRSTAAKVEAYAVGQMARAKLTPVQADQLRQSALATHQLTARLTQRSATAVDIPPGTPEHLVTGFAMPPNAQHIQLDFQCRPELSARVLLQTAELFQWLAALQRQYLKAGWSMEVWPDWFTQKSKS
jgi:hypothetical protein